MGGAHQEYKNNILDVEARGNLKAPLLYVISFCCGLFCSVQCYAMLYCAIIYGVLFARWIGAPPTRRQWAP